MRCTEVRPTPATLAISRPVQWVVSPGGSPSVRATTRSATSSGRRGVPGGRVLSRSRPSRPSSMNRACQRQTAVLLTPAVRMIAAVPNPSAVPSTIRARHTCFCRLLRSSTIACRRLRSVGIRWTMTPVRIPQTRTTPRLGESHPGLLCPDQSTRLRVERATVPGTTKPVVSIGPAPPAISPPSSASRFSSTSPPAGSRPICIRLAWRWTTTAPPSPSLPLLRPCRC